MMKSFRRMAILGAAVFALSQAVATDVRAQAEQLPADLQQQVMVALQQGDAEALTALQALVSANPAFAGAIAATFAAQRPALAGTVATVAVGAQPGLAASIVDALATVITDTNTLVQVYTNAAAIMPDQAGTLATVVTERAAARGQDVTAVIVTALQQVEPAAGPPQQDSPPPPPGPGTGQVGQADPPGENPAQTDPEPPSPTS